MPRGADTPPEEGPSRSSRKRASEELQTLGEQIAALSKETIANLPLPEPLREALADAKRIETFGGRRRHAQYIGKLMRRVDPDALEAARDAVSAARRRRRGKRRCCIGQNANAMRCSKATRRSSAGSRKVQAPTRSVCAR
jgi:ribosomal 50S subunit-associated protein YjgA (DUF615 family)